MSIFRHKSILLLFGCIFALATAETILWSAGYKAGLFCYYDNLPEVDDIIDTPQLTTDQDGINRISIEARELLYKLKRDSGNPDLQQPQVSYELAELWRERNVFSELPHENEFIRYFKSVNAMPLIQRDEHGAAVLNFVDNPINSDGFRSIEFKNYGGSRKKILLLGDSFTWGYTTKSKTDSFADILLARGYFVFNSGIGGMDPAQYLRVARKYVPLLRPDVVIVNFYAGNDPQYFRREPKLGIPLLFHTNVGPLYSWNEGIYLDTSSEIYKVVLRRCQIPPTSLFNRLMSTTRIFSLVWTSLAEMGKYETRHPEDIALDRIRTEFYPSTYSDVEIKEIQSIAEKYKAQFVVAVIPQLQGDTLTTLSDSILEDFSYSVPQLTATDYVQGDGHLNEDGHLKYANFLEKLFNSTNDKEQ